MTLLKTIKFKDISPEEESEFEIRRAARAVVFDADNKVGLLYVKKYNYHKLPGGGLEGDENIKEALYRECQEEIGCQIEAINEIGEIIEYRDKWALKQHSYCFIAKVVGAKGSPEFTEKELDYGFEIKWVTLDEAISLLENDSPEGYEGPFIHVRDSVFLEQALKQLR